MSDGLLNESRLRAALGARPFRLAQRTGSTNDIARQWAVDGAPAGSVVIAEEQTAGRGRFGRSWSAPAGSALLVSVIVRPDASSSYLPRLTMVGAVSMAEVLAELTPGQVSLKWPNDVLLNGRKVAGVLPEAIWEGERLSAVVLGIGLNVRVDFAGTPLVNRAISVEAVTGTTVDRAALLAALLGRVDHWSARLGDPALSGTWRGWLSTLGQRVAASHADRQTGRIIGLALDVEADGALLLRTDDGLVHRVVAGEVTLADDQVDGKHDIGR
jgi:BirA family biotin operon repressor/biotin-[acetyl-CoA-carboxylase] ligase